jgi:hypothetical protein
MLFGCLDARDGNFKNIFNILKLREKYFIKINNNLLKIFYVT